MVVKAGFQAAMPTVYRGVQLRSRLEAQSAYLLDTLNMTWQYEPKSYMLAGGTTYLPDFYVDSQRMYLECRGYDSARGAEQITQFGKSVSDGQVGPEGKAVLRYVALQQDSVSCYRPRQPPSDGCLVARCRVCDAWAFFGFGDGCCPTCLEHGSTITTAFVVAVQAGKILLNGTTSEYWDGLIAGPVDPTEAV